MATDFEQDAGAGLYRSYYEESPGAKPWTSLSHDERALWQRAAELMLLACDGQVAYDCWREAREEAGHFADPDWHSLTWEARNLWIKVAYGFRIE